MILNTTDLVLELQERIRTVRDTLITEDCFVLTLEDLIIATTFASIRREAEAELELAYAGFEVFKEIFFPSKPDTAIPNSIHHVSKLVEHFGHRLISRVRYMRLYQAGYLNYRFTQRIGTDVILTMDRDTMDFKQHCSAYDPDPGL